MSKKGAVDAIDYCIKDADAIYEMLEEVEDVPPALFRKLEELQQDLQTAEKEVDDIEEAE